MGGGGGEAGPTCTLLTVHGERNAPRTQCRGISAMPLRGSEGGHVDRFTISPREGRSGTENIRSRGKGTEPNAGGRNPTQGDVPP